MLILGKKSLSATTISSTEFMQMAPTSKYLIWKSDTEGIYIRAHRVSEDLDTVSFIRETSTIDVTVATYKLKDIKGYSKVE
jgi:hypothetical protein